MKLIFVFLAIALAFSANVFARSTPQQNLLRQSLVEDARDNIIAYALAKEGTAAKQMICFTGGRALTSMTMLNRLGLVSDQDQARALEVSPVVYAKTAEQLREMDAYCNFGTELPK